MAVGSSKAKGRKGKLGKNKHRIANYYNSGQNYWNKARRLVHHLRKQVDDKATESLKACLAGLSLARSREFKKLYSVEG